MTLTSIAVTRSDLIAIQRSIEDAYAEVEAAVGDGDVDDSILFGLGESLDTIEQYLNDNRD